ncbi:MAG: T9SS type A sorting domain-containing protein [Bacteroidia bacterium]|nr:T9SS type A sorting domain-containing protein [Bacteroidia bacterium]
MKKIYMAVLALFLYGSSQAQQVRNCGTMPHLHDLEQADPGLSARMQAIERETDQWIQSGTANKGAVVVTIPVVVHVVYNNSTQNISDAQINSQINILNQDFRKTNSDISLVPAVFSSLTADCEIQFCLAQRDPNGNATNGIVRRSTTVTSFSSNDNIKFYSSGGSDAWPVSSYLNIWVGNLGGGLLGYAQFPGGPAATDGIVILHSAFGNTGTAAAPFNKGRTATHEIGHWLNLRHIWGDANCGNDQVSDTPTQQTANYGCPAFPRITCSNGPNGDMFMNYMDYTDDACMYMFSNGQKARMLASLNGTRASLLTSNGCIPPVAGTCGTPSGLNATNITTTSATLNWLPVNGAISYNVQYRLLGSGTWTNTVSTTLSLSLTGLSSGNSYEYQVQAVCSSATGSFSSVATFSTNAPNCSDTYEGNNSKAKATIIPVNTNVTAKIGSATDKDWFKFTTLAGATNLKVVLDQLPADYDLKLYNANGNQIAVSQLGGTSTETIIRNTSTAGNYFVQVLGYNGAFSKTSCYRLRINASGTSFRSGMGTEYTEGNINAEKAESMDEIQLYPNPAGDFINLSFFHPEEGTVVAEIIDILGKTISSHSINAAEGFNRAELNVSGLNNGIYFLRLQQGEDTAVRKFIVKH